MGQLSCLCRSSVNAEVMTAEQLCLTDLCVDALAAWLHGNPQDDVRLAHLPTQRSKLSFVPWPICERVIHCASQKARSQNGCGLNLGHLRHFYGGQLSDLSLCFATDISLVEILSPSLWPSLRRIHLVDPGNASSRITDTTLARIASLDPPHIQTITLDSCGPFEDFTRLSMVPARNNSAPLWASSLTELNLPNSRIRLRSSNDVRKTFGVFTALRCLDISRNDGVCNAAMKELRATVAPDSLCDINLSEFINVTDSGLGDFLVVGRQGCRPLRQIDVSETVTARAIGMLAKVEVNWESVTSTDDKSTLQCLRWENHWPRPDDSQIATSATSSTDFATSLRALTGLTELHISTTTLNMSRNCAAALVDTIPCLVHLKSLALEQLSGVSDDILHVLPPSLCTLSLAGCPHIGLSDLEALPNSVPTLQSLKIDGCNVRPESFFSIGLLAQLQELSCKSLSRSENMGMGPFLRSFALASESSLKTYSDLSLKNDLHSSPEDNPSSSVDNEWDARMQAGSNGAMPMSNCCLTLLKLDGNRMVSKADHSYAQNSEDGYNDDAEAFELLTRPHPCFAKLATLSWTAMHFDEVRRFKTAINPPRNLRLVVENVPFPLGRATAEDIDLLRHLEDAGVSVELKKRSSGRSATLKSKSSVVNSVWKQLHVQRDASVSSQAAVISVGVDSRESALANQMVCLATSGATFAEKSPTESCTATSMQSTADRERKAIVIRYTAAEMHALRKSSWSNICPWLPNIYGVTPGHVATKP